MTREAERAAEAGRHELRFPFVGIFLNMLEEFDVPLNDSRPRETTPAPEPRRRRAGDARDGGGRPLVRNDN